MEKRQGGGRAIYYDRETIDEQEVQACSLEECHACPKYYKLLY